MSDTRFDVYFSGQLAPGVDADQAAVRLARLFKTEPDRLAPLFTGRPALVKRNLSRAEAVRYRQALSQAGMTSVFREHGAPAPQPPSGEPQPVPGHPANPPRDALAAESAAATPEVANSPPAAAAFTLAPAGSDVLTPDERRPVAAVAVDISGLSLAPAGADLLRPEERPERPAVEVDTSALELIAISPADAPQP